MPRTRNAPAPWSIYNPNGEWAKKHKAEVGYEPIWLHDANNDRVLYVGNNTQNPSTLAIAKRIVKAINKGE